MSEVSRRDAIRFLALAPLSAFAVTPQDVEAAATLTRKVLSEQAVLGQSYRPRVFTAEEWQTARILVDMIIPRDSRSGSATDAMVPEFMDVFMVERQNMQRWMHAGLAWLDGECRRRFDSVFADCTESQRRAVLDDIAWPAKAPAAMRDGVRFFNNFRNFTASGFWSSRIGVKDLQYMGNMPMIWQGCPTPALDKLGVKYPAG